MQKTDLNVSPYYDDFDTADNFHRVLFRPGFAVQARELTTLQSIMQNQIERFGRHMFKEGSMIIPGQVSFTNAYYAVKLQTTFNSASIAGYLSSFVGSIVTGNVSGITARVVGYADATSTDAPTLYVKYLTSAINDANATASTGASVANATTIFVNGESLASDKVVGTFTAGSNSVTLETANATAFGSSAGIEEGVFFIRGQFVRVPAQRIILDKYTNTPSYRVGLTVTESLVTPESDTSLLDNATGSSNINAKGAHRLQITLTLDKLPLGSTDDENFVELMRLKNGSVERIVDKTDYNIFQENLARRTFDESGNYTVRPFGIDIKETLDTGDNSGIYTSTQTTDQGNTPSESLATVQIDPGKAYVRGYEIETVTPAYLDFEKPRTTDEFDDAISNIEVGNFVRVNNVFGSPDLSTFISGDVPVPHRAINLWSEQNNTPGSQNTTQGSQIGVARARGFEHVSGTDGTTDEVFSATSIFNLYLFDIRMFTVLTMNAAPSGAGTPVAAGSKITGATSGATGFIHSTSSTKINLINVVGSFSTGEKIVSSSSQESDQILAQSAGGTDITISSLVAHNFDAVKSLYMDGTGTGGDFTADLELTSLVTLGQGNNVSVSMNGSNGNVTGFNTDFLIELRVGDIVTVPGAGAGGADLTAKVNTITSKTAIVLATNSATAVSGVPIVRKRNQLRDQEKNVLLRKLRKKRIKTLKTARNTDAGTPIQTTFTFRKTFVGTSNANGEITLTGGGTETFAADSNTDYIATCILKGSVIGSNSSGDLANLGENANFNYTSGTSFTPSGNTLVITNPKVFGSGGKFKIVATLTRTQAGEKTKTLNPCQLTLVETTAHNPYGTNHTNKEISLGRADHYKLYAVLDSEDTGTVPSLPQADVTGVSGTFNKGEIIKGAVSDCLAVVINPTNPITFIVTNNKAFTNNETITGQTDGATATISNITAGSKNITDRFTLDTGQRDNFYDISRIVRKGGKPTPVGQLLVVSNYFAHSTGDFFTVDSYGGVDYKEIPTYTATRVDPEVREPSGEFDLRDSVDFRPRVADATLNTSTTNQNQTLTKVTSMSFDFISRAFNGTGSVTSSVPKDNSNFQYDFEFFLGRRDLLYLTEDGLFKIVKGTPAERPEFPKTLEKAMLVASIEAPPYVLNIDDIVFVKAKNKRYTMKDIGALDRRINQLQYYTALSLLEKDAKSFQVQDENGFDRFKSGFVVDNFSGHSVGDVQNEDYRNAIDYAANELRPKFFMKGISLVEENTTDAQRTNDGYQKTGDMITLPYTDVVTVQQEFASRVENLNPVLTFTWTGICELNPSGDEWFEVNRLPKLIINVEGNFDQLVAQVGNAMGTVWNSWQTQWSGVSVSNDIVSQTNRTTSSANWWGTTITSFQDTVTRTTTTTTEQQTRTGINTQVIAQIDEESQGDKLRSQALIPFMRAKNITFVAQGMKPVTRVYPFFDKVNVSSFVTPDSNGYSTASLGGKLVTDGNGEVSGLFQIPDPNVSGNPQFPTGERLFRLTSSDTNQNAPEPETFAQATFSSTGILNTIQEEIIATRNGKIVTTAVADSRVVSSSTSATSSSTQQTGQQFVMAENEDEDEEEGIDPLAQTFYGSQPGGEMITKVEAFFQRKDATIPVLCQIREVSDGFPTIRQLPFGGKYLSPYLKGTVAMTAGSNTVTGTGTDFLTGTHNIRVGDTITIQGLGSETSGVATDVDNYDTAALVAKITAINSDTELTVDEVAATGGSGKKISNINLSDDASKPTTFRFDSPVHLKDSNIEYCIVLLTPCESYFAWISRMGELDTGGTRMISKQPHLGVLFKSQNNTTWNSFQYEDLKFTIYRAQFTAGASGKLTLTNDTVPSQTLPADPIRTINTKQFVQVTHPNHHMYSTSNNVTISGVSSGITTTLSSAIASASTTSISITANSNFVASAQTGGPGGLNFIFVKIGNEVIQGTITGNTITATSRGLEGTASAHDNGSTVELYQMNGIPLTEINKTHISIGNIGIDSYTVTTNTAATSSSNQGGASVVATENAMMDGGQTLLPVVQFPDTTVTSSIRTTSATSPSGTETSFDLQGSSFAKSITLGENFFFEKPRQILSTINETNELAGSKSFFLDVDLSTQTQALSPIVDLDRKSIIAFSNRVNRINSASDVSADSVLALDYVASDQPSGDSNEAIYITRRSALETPATGIKVILDANRFASANIKLMFKILRSDDASDFDEIGYQFFNTTGGPDSTVNASLDNDDFKEHQYTANDLDEFIAFSIKIVMQGTNSSEPPRIKDLRAIALAT